ncbi:MAG: zinc-binding dehydrogenase [Bacteroidia bacterium]|nr:zinc-binding dehydrogenase [Bacteroidia bacterium]
MKALFITKFGKPDESFELRDVPDPILNEGEILIKTQGFGVNYADIMARMGLYQDCPPLPAIIGYEVVGFVEKLGKGVQGFSEGDRVLAFTRFGGYAEKAKAPAIACVKIDASIPLAEATALATQYCTAYFASHISTRLFKDDHVLVQAAAGGVGTALVQLAKLKGCTVYGTAGSEEKCKHLRELGVDFPINYNTEQFDKKIRQIRNGKGVDVVFDSLGGMTFDKGFKLLNPTGRIIGFGAAESSGSRNPLNLIKLLWGFGFRNAVFLLIQSRSIIGLNMLRVADNRPDMMQYCMENVLKLYMEGKIKPVQGGTFKSTEIAQAHAFVQSRKSMGKIAVEWVS